MLIVVVNALSLLQKRGMTSSYAFLIEIQLTQTQTVILHGGDKAGFHHWEHMSLYNNCYRVHNGFYLTQQSLKGALIVARIALV